MNMNPFEGAPEQAYVEAVAARTMGDFIDLLLAAQREAEGMGHGLEFIARNHAAIQTLAVDAALGRLWKAKARESSS